MSSNSETQFLFTILLPHGYDSHKQDCNQFLANLCQMNEQAFLGICRGLVELIGEQWLLNPELPDNVLKKIAEDLSQILPALWKLQKYGELVQHILHARSMANSAYKEADKDKKDEYLMKCFNGIDAAYKFLNGI